MRNGLSSIITVGTCGCFDLLHAGHIQYLTDSKKLGDHLTILINSDRWVMENKKKLIFPQEERKMILEALECVDEVIIFDTDEEKNQIILEKRFDIWTKATNNGGYNSIYELPETPAIQSYGGKIVLIPSSYPHCSSSLIFDQIRKDG